MPKTQPRWVFFRQNWVPKTELWQPLKGLAHGRLNLPCISWGTVAMAGLISLSLLDHELLKSSSSICLVSQCFPIGKDSQAPRLVDADLKNTWVICEQSWKAEWGRHGSPPSTTCLSACPAQGQGHPPSLAYSGAPNHQFVRQCLGNIHCPFT